ASLFRKDRPDAKIFREGHPVQERLPVTGEPRLPYRCHAGRGDVRLHRSTSPHQRLQTFLETHPKILLLKSGSTFSILPRFGGERLTNFYNDRALPVTQLHQKTRSHSTHRSSMRKSWKTFELEYWSDRCFRTWGIITVYGIVAIFPVGL